MNENISNINTIASNRSISLSLLFKHQSFPKSIITNASTNRTSNINTAMQHTPRRSYYSYSSTFLSSSNSFRTIVKEKSKSISSSPMLYKLIKPKNIIRSKVAFMKCAPKSTSCMLKNTIGIMPSLPIKKKKETELSSNSLKLFCQITTKEHLEDLILKQKMKTIKHKKVFPILSSKKKINNFLLNDNKNQTMLSETPDMYLQNAFNPIFKHQKKIYSKHMNAIMNDLSTNISDFSIIQPKKFSERYRPFLKERNEDEDEDKLSRHECRITELPLQKDIDKIIETKRSYYKMKHKQSLLDKYKKVMIQAAIHFQKLHMSLEDFYSSSHESLSDYSHQETKLLMNAIKNADLVVIAELIKHYHCLVYDYDNFKRTPLHWAAKRNLYQVIPLMLSKRANINARDSIGNTPLHYAANSCNLESIQLLLYAIANPYIKNNKQWTPFNYTQKPIVQFILARYEKIYKVHKIGNSKEYESCLKIELDHLFKDELQFSMNWKVCKENEIKKEE